MSSRNLNCTGRTRGPSLVRCAALGTLVALSLSASSCTFRSELVPASDHANAIGRRTLAVESRGGVTVTADASAWDGAPATLDSEVTPVWVTLRNTSERPLRIQYDEFTLQGASGAHYGALAPYVMRAAGTGSPFTVPDGGYFDRFYVAAYLRPYYPWLPPWCGPLPYGPSFRSVAGRPGLPSASMLQRALPEGVLASGGTASGYLYFEKVSRQDSKVTFSAELREPSPQRAERRIASIAIPFRRATRPHRPTNGLYTEPPRPSWDPP